MSLKIKFIFINYIFYELENTMEDLCKLFINFRVITFKHYDDSDDEVYNFRIKLYDDIQDFRLDLIENNCFFPNKFDEQLDYYITIVSCCDNGIRELLNRGFINTENVDVYQRLYNEYRLEPYITSERQSIGKIQNKTFKSPVVEIEGNAMFAFITREIDTQNMFYHNGKKHKYKITLYSYIDLLN